MQNERNDACDLVKDAKSGLWTLKMVTNGDWNAASDGPELVQAILSNKITLSPYSVWFDDGKDHPRQPVTSSMIEKAANWKDVKVTLHFKWIKSARGSFRAAAIRFQTPDSAYARTARATTPVEKIGRPIAPIAPIALTTIKRR